MDNGWLRWLIGPALLLVSVAWGLLAFRTYGVLLFLAVIVLFIAFVRGGRIMPLAIAWLLFFVSAFVPVDFAPYVFGGQPRLVPVGLGCFDAIGYENQTMGRLIIGWPGVPGLTPKRVLIWYQPPPQKEFNQMSAWHLKMISDYLNLYTYDQDDKLPVMRTRHDVESALTHYDHDLGPQIFVQPQTNTQYVPNPMLSGKKIDAMAHSESVIEYAEAQPAPNGTRGVVFVDGHTDRLTPFLWQQLWSEPVSEPRANSKKIVSPRAARSSAAIP